jgi:DNA topoisomerase IB
VTLSHGQLVFEYLAKRAKQREPAVAEEQVCAVVQSLRRRRDGGDQLLAYRSGPRWHDVSAADINDYLREVSRGDYTAKDFRTWHATVLAAVDWRCPGASGTDTARKRAIARVVREVADYLGNTPPCYLGNTPPWPGPLISIRASSSSTRTVTRSLRCLVTWTGTAISAISPPGGAPRVRW